MKYFLDLLSSLDPSWMPSTSTRRSTKEIRGLQTAFKHEMQIQQKDVEKRDPMRNYLNRDESNTNQTPGATF